MKKPYLICMIEQKRFTGAVALTFKLSASITFGFIRMRVWFYIEYPH